MQPTEPVAAIRAAFPDAVLDVIEFRGETTVVVPVERIVEVATFLRDGEGLQYNFLVDAVGIDYWPTMPRFAVSYNFYSMLFNRKLRLQVRLGEADTADEDLLVPSLASEWPGAAWQEREIFDMFGIRFENNPDMRRILNPPDWDGYPQRRDYPLGYETVQFSFNYEEINKHKPYAKE
jgi:NADH-quinone oxidoreductase subunit C